MIDWFDKQGKNNDLIKEKIIQLSDFYLETKINNYDIFKLINFIDESKLENKIQWTYEKIIEKEKESLIKINNLIKEKNQNYKKDLKIKDKYKIYILNFFFYNLKF